MNRDAGIGKFCIGTWAIVGLYHPNGVETLLRSNSIIEKAQDYDILHRWLGLGLLTRY